MKAEMTREEMLAEMVAVVRRVKLVQQERGLSDTKLVDEFKELGSQKTWADRLRTETFEGLNIERWLNKMRRVATILDGGSPEDEFFRHLPFAREMEARMLRLERQQGDRRILPCLAANGTGKSVFSRWAVSQSRSTRVLVRIRPSWRNKIVHLCGGIARALGEENRPSSPAAAEDVVIRMLTSHPRTVFLDQAHEGGVALMDVIRELVDETPSRFVYLAYDTAYRAVLSATTDAQIEAQAFMGRCLKPAFDLYRAGTRPEDVAVFLQEAAALSKVAAESLAPRITPALQRHTNLRLLDDAIVAARASSKSDDPPAESIREQVYRLSGLDPKQFNQVEDA